jgi:hypothetical protein
MTASEAAGKVRSGGDHVAPSATDRIQELVITELGGDVHGAAVQVELAHGMAGDRGGIANREMVLPIGPWAASDYHEGNRVHTFDFV